MSYYCENCYKENLKYICIDVYGSVFCSPECLVQSEEYREIDFNEDLIFYTEVLK